MIDAADINLSNPELWVGSIADREAAFAALRRDRPVGYFEEWQFEFSPLPAGPGYWALTKHADILHVSRNPELFCSGKGTQIPDQPPMFDEFFGSMINMDEPKHGRMRRIVSRGFTPRMINAYEADVQTVATRIIDDVIEKGSCDFVTDIAARLPLWIICNMMGIPESEHQSVFDKTNIILGAGDPEYVDDPTLIIPKLLQSGAELSQLLQELGRERRKQPTGDLTSDLVNAELDGDQMTDAELGSFFVLLAVAGNETTRNAISHGMKALCDNPEQREIWQQDFDAVAPTAVEEIVRWATPVIHFRRTATQDTEIRGQKIEAGQKVVLFYNSGNRDEDAFDQPDRFDVRRTPNEHVGFGGPGPHHCLGAHLARREITIMFREIFRRLPDLRITGEPDRLASMFINGIKHMPCEWTVG